MVERIILHLLVFDPSRQHILVQADNLGNKWLTPVVTCEGPSVRYVPMLPDGLSRFGIAAWPVHDAAVHDPLSKVRHRYCAFIVRKLETKCRQNWIPINTALRMSALLNVQQTALATCVDRFRHPVAALDTPESVNESEAWARSVLATKGYTSTGEPSILKHKRDRRTIMFPTMSGVMYLKVGARVPKEAAVADVLADMFTGQFVRTVDLERTRRWWLYEGLPGEALLSVDRLTPDVCRRIGAAVAIVQQRSIEGMKIRAALEGAQICVSDLLAVVDFAEALVQQYATTHAEMAALHTHSAWHAIREVCTELGSLPISYLHGDLWVPNIVDCGTALGFIDLEPSLWGPVVLCWWPLLSRLGGARRYMAQEIVNSYVHEWPKHSRERLVWAIGSLGVTGRLFQLKLRLDAHRYGPMDYPKLAHDGAPTKALVQTLMGLLISAQAAREDFRPS